MARRGAGRRGSTGPGAGGPAAVLVAAGLLAVGWPGSAAGEAPAAAPARPDAVEQVAARARESVVTIRSSGRGERDGGLGTGFVVSPDGLIATNYHVIGDGRPVSVELADGSRHDVVAIHASERAADLAIVRIARQGLVALELGDPATLADGREVVALGNPHGLERSVVSGRVSGRREIDGRTMIQLAIPIEPGNSGGPLLDLEGRVHGVVTMKSLVTPFLGFAVGVDQLAPLLENPNPVTMDRWLTIGAIDPREWTVVGGARWRQRAGRISVEGAGSGFGGRSLCLAVAEPPELPHEIAVWVKLDDEAGAAGLVFGSDGGDRHYGFYPSAGGLRLTRFDGPDVLSWAILEDRPSAAYRPGDWNHLRVRRTAEGIACLVNDVPVFASADAGLGRGRVGLAKFRDTKAEFRGFAAGRDLPPSRPDAAVAARVVALGSTALGPEGAAEAIRGLVAEGAAGDAALLERADALEREGKVLRGLAREVQARRTVEALERLLAADGPVDLYGAALLVSALDNPELDTGAARGDLERLAADVAAAAPAEADEPARLAVLDRVLFQELGFHGSRGDYYNRANSHVDEVVDDREGIPITLAVVYMELARRQGLAMEGVGLPGHFLVRHLPGDGGAGAWIDVFDGAKRLDREGVAALYRGLRGAELTDDLLAPVGPRPILFRMLNNLLGIASRDDDAPAMLRYLDAMLVVDPEASRERVMRMLMAKRLGKTDAALADARWLLDNGPADIDLEAVRRFVADTEARR